MVSTRELEKRLRGLADPRPPADLRARLEATVPPRFGASEATRRSVGMSALRFAAVAAVLVLLIVNVASRPAYAEKLAAVATASGEEVAIHVVAQVRSAEREDFDHVDIDGPFIEYEVWIENAPDRSRMHVRKPGRSYVFDGTHSTWFHPDRNEAFRTEGGGIDRRLLWPAAWIERVLDDPDDDVTVVSLEENDRVGRVVLRWPAPDMNGKTPSSFNEFDREVLLEWDAASLHLLRMERRVFHDGDWVTVWIVSTIEYSSGFDEDVFDVGIPDDVDWIEIGPAKELAVLGPGEAAAALWQAAIDGDEDTLWKLCPFPSLVRFLEENPPTELIELGKPYRAGNYPGYYVPYVVRFGEGEDAWIKEGNLAMRNDNEHSRFVFDGGI